MNKPQTPCQKAIEAAGGPAALAKAMNARGVPIRSQAISQWKKVPIKRALLVADITGIPRQKLLPEIYGGMS